MLPECETLLLREEPGILHVTLNRPAVRNAMSLGMVTDLEAVFAAIAEDRGVRCVVLRGAEGHFCSGGDVKEMAAARSAQPKEGEMDPLATTNRRFGKLVAAVDNAPQAVVAILEGAVMGGGFGLACVADIAITHAEANFRLPETSLGIPPAQIAPFLVRRLGLSHARRLAVTGVRMNGREAQALGLVHFVCDDNEALEAKLGEVLDQIDRCAPAAIALTKRLMLQVGQVELNQLLDEAALQFAKAARGPDGIEGVMAFLQKRPPHWSKRKS